MSYTQNDYLSISTISDAYAAHKRLADLLLNVLKRYAPLVEPDVSKGIYTMAYPSFINIIERNIDLLASGEFVPSEMLSTVDWQGEFLDRRRLSYKDVNRWFDSTELIEKLMYGVAARSPVTGTFRTGTNRTAQLVRRVV